LSRNHPLVQYHKPNLNLEIPNKSDLVSISKN